ncbi:hypothetical protein [Parabacteroides provencensis]|uniref:hypothetical protein n=1 Tax=Parabacteroides provencensis TaxID=1944636 RepID=UPI000C15D481|nr:hypothetical protein [Parabacteroides provencensis]
MRSIINNIGILLMVVLFAGACSSGYEVGTSSVSLEPTDETVSVTLGGYASPWEGRFSLTWDCLGENKLLSVTACKDSVVILDREKRLYYGDKKQLLPAREIGKAPSVKQISFCDGYLYGVTMNNRLVRTLLESGIAVWEDVRFVPQVKGITSSNGNLYAVDLQDHLYKGVLNGTVIEWNDIGFAPEIAEIASDNKRLYVLTKDTILYQRSLDKADERWQRIGYKNNETFTIDVAHLNCLDGHLYVVSDDGFLYSNKHSSVGDIKAKAMSIRKDGKTVVIVGVDVCGLNKSLTDDIKAEIRRKRGVDENAILINASHTHYAPVTQSWATWQKPNQYPDSLYLLNVVYKGIVQAIEESLDNMEPSSLYFGRDTCSIGRNRSLTGEDVIYDNVVDVIVSVADKDKKKTVLFMAGCHPVFPDPEVGRYTLNANYPGYTKELLEQDGDIRNSIFLQAFAGDVNPVDPFRTTARKLAGAVATIMKADLKPIKGAVSYSFDTIIPPVVAPWTKEQILQFRERSLKIENDIAAERDVNWANIQLASLEENGKLPEMPVYYQTLNVGDWKLVALSREVTTEYGLAIRAIWPEQKVSVVAYSNDVSSYLATPPHIRAKDYEGYESFFWYAQPTCFSKETFPFIINKIKENNY